jgi:aspartyl-tRNA(Asn)/glutamyl-tRNA(Gln) amidotransferase subunit A
MSGTDLTELSAAELHRLLVSGEATATELTEAFLSRIHQYDPALGAFLHVDEEGARRQAAQIDRDRRAGKPLGALAGLPLAIKDNICTKDQLTTCASRILGNFRPPYDATVVSRLRAAGAVLLGKTNLDEFGMGGSNEFSAFRLTRNPWDPARVPGGSSGGSAAAVAAGLAPAALGTDTGGSIRQPAALCGVAGLKPTYGRVSRFGLVAYASSLDQIGPIGRSAEDLALLLEVLAGHDPLDATSAPQEVPPYRQLMQQPVGGLRLGVLSQQLGEGVDPQVAAAIAEAVAIFRKLGVEIVEVDLPYHQLAVACYYIIAPSEASSNLARYDGVHYGYRCDERAMADELAAERRLWAEKGSDALPEEPDPPIVRLYRKTRVEGFGPEVKRRIMLGTYALSAGYYEAYYLQAAKVRRLIRTGYDQVFREVAALLGPVTPTPAFRIGEKIADPLAMYLFDAFTVGANLAGICALAIPCGISQEGLPIGLQLQGPPFTEARLLQLAYWFQQQTDWHRRRPPLQSNLARITSGNFQGATGPQ